MSSPSCSCARSRVTASSPADRGSAVLTGRPSALASALIKISGAIERAPSQDLRRVEGSSALFHHPSARQEVIDELFADHPPLEQRLGRARAPGVAAAGWPEHRQRLANWACATSSPAAIRSRDPRPDPPVRDHHGLCRPAGRAPDRPLRQRRNRLPGARHERIRIDHQRHGRSRRRHRWRQRHDRQDRRRQLRLPLDDPAQPRRRAERRRPRRRHQRRLQLDRDRRLRRAPAVRRVRLRRRAKTAASTSSTTTSAATGTHSCRRPATRRSARPSASCS